LIDGYHSLNIMLQTASNFWHCRYKLAYVDGCGLAYLDTNSLPMQLTTSVTQDRGASLAGDVHKIMKLTGELDDEAKGRLGRES